MDNKTLYDWLLQQAATPLEVENLCLGLSWTMLQTREGVGFAFSPRQVPRTLSWAGTVAGQSLSAVAPWLCSWDGAKSVVGLAAVNAAINSGQSCAEMANPLHLEVPGHLQVFAHFRNQLQDKKVVVIGHYPGLEQLWSDLPYQCLERHPQGDDLPDSAAEYLLPCADWVFITASSLVNKSLPRLLQLSTAAKVVLMGPSLPWLADWKQFGVDYLAGVRVRDQVAAAQVVAEGGGTRLFAGPVEYALLALK